MSSSDGETEGADVRPPARRWVNRPNGARGYSWPPFEPGNQVARTHGAYAADVPDKAREIVDVLFPPEVVDRYGPMTLAAATVWVRWCRANADLEERGLVLEDGSVNPCAVIASRCEAKLLDFSARFGLDPKSEAQLARDRAAASLVGFDLSVAIAAGRAVIDARSDEPADDSAGISEVADAEVES